MSLKFCTCVEELILRGVKAAGMNVYFRAAIFEWQGGSGLESASSSSSSSSPASQFKDGTKTKAHTEELPNCLEPS